MTSKTTNRFSPEVRVRAVRMVLDREGEHRSRWAAVSSIAAKIGCTARFTSRISALSFPAPFGKELAEIVGDGRDRRDAFLRREPLKGGDNTTEAQFNISKWQHAVHGGSDLRIDGLRLRKGHGLLGSGLKSR